MTEIKYIQIYIPFKSIYLNKSMSMIQIADRLQNCTYFKSINIMVILNINPEIFHNIQEECRCRFNGCQSAGWCGNLNIQFMRKAIFICSYKHFFCFFSNNISNNSSKRIFY